MHGETIFHDSIKIPLECRIHSPNTLSVIIVFAQSPKSVERAVFSLKVREHIRSQGPLLLEIWIGQQQIFCIKADSGKTYQIFHLLINSGEQSPRGKTWWPTKCRGGTQASLASRGSVSPEQESCIKIGIYFKTWAEFCTTEWPKFPETILFNNAGPLMKMNRFPARKGSPVLDTARMRCWLARRRWLKAGTVLRALQRMAKVVKSASHSRKEPQELPLSNYSRLQKILDDLDKMWILKMEEFWERMRECSRLWVKT